MSEGLEGLSHFIAEILTTTPRNSVTRARRHLKMRGRGWAMVYYSLYSWLLLLSVIYEIDRFGNHVCSVNKKWDAAQRVQFPSQLPSCRAWIEEAKWPMGGKQWLWGWAKFIYQYPVTVVIVPLGFLLRSIVLYLCASPPPTVIQHNMIISPWYGDFCQNYISYRSSVLLLFLVFMWKATTEE